MVRQRIRIRFGKSGNLKYIGHKDLMHSLELLFRRARLPLAMSSGFHPKIKMSLPSALALGVESFDEVLELEINESAQPVDPTTLLTDLNRCSVKGLDFYSARQLDKQETKAKLASSTFELFVPKELCSQTVNRVSAFLSADSVIAEKSNGKFVNVRTAINELRFSHETGQMTVEILAQNGSPEAGIRELLQALGLEKELFKSIFPKRIRCRLTEEILIQEK
ncbi:MAG: TIGR03936 family radical SAM-associated protein [Planctomycetaceae bacterium]|jgi:radical SAM-linked protein|nr:TIGR03936 family radical SAM-associated protein [Planctomycetaceae bacterium]